MEKAKALAPLLVAAAADTTKFIVAESRSHSTDYEDKLGVVFLETVFFYLHVADRTAFQFVGAKKKGTFFDALFFEVRERSSRVQESGIEASTLRDSFNEAFTTAQAEYTACDKIFPSEQGLGAAAFHLYSSKIVRILGVEKGEMIFTSVPNFAILGEPTLIRIVLALDIPALLAESWRKHSQQSIGVRVGWDIEPEMHNRMWQYFSEAFGVIADRGYAPQVARSHACFVVLKAVITPPSVWLVQQGVMRLEEAGAVVTKIFDGRDDMAREIGERLDEYRR